MAEAVKSQLEMAQMAGWSLSLAAHLGLGLALLGQNAQEAAPGRAVPEAPGMQVVLLDARSNTGFASGLGEMTVVSKTLDAAADSSGKTDESSVADKQSTSEGAGDFAAGSASSSVSGQFNDVGTPDLDAFQRRLLEHISRFKSVPAGLDAPPKPVLVRFVLQKDGSVSDAWVYASSGHHSFDTVALQTVLRAQPLPAPPAGLPDPLNVVLPVPFVTQSG